MIKFLFSIFAFVQILQACSLDSSPRLVATPQTVTQIDSMAQEIVFLPWTQTDSQFPECGFKSYEISAVESETAISVELDSSMCSTSISCLKTKIINGSQYDQKTLTFTIKGYIQADTTVVSQVFSVQIRTCNSQKISTSYDTEIKFQVPTHLTPDTKAEVILPFQNIGIDLPCGVKEIRVHTCPSVLKSNELYRADWVCGLNYADYFYFQSVASIDECNHLCQYRGCVMFALDRDGRCFLYDTTCQVTEQNARTLYLGNSYNLQTYRPIGYSSKNNCSSSRAILESKNVIDYELDKARLDVFDNISRERCHFQCWMNAICELYLWVTTTQKCMLYGENRFIHLTYDTVGTGIEEYRFSNTGCYPKTNIDADCWSRAEQATCQLNSECEWTTKDGYGYPDLTRIVMGNNLEKVGGTPVYTSNTISIEDQTYQDQPSSAVLIKNGLDNSGILKINKNQRGFYRFKAEAILNDLTSVWTEQFYGDIACSTSIPQISRTMQPEPFYIAEGEPFRMYRYVSAHDFAPGCGFSHYHIMGENINKLIFMWNQYSEKFYAQEECPTLQDCLTRNIVASRGDKLKFYLKTVFHQPYAKQETIYATVGCQPLQPTYTKIYTFQASRINEKPQIDLTPIFSGFEGVEVYQGCAIKKVQITIINDAYSVIQPIPEGNPIQPYIEIDNSKPGSFKFTVTVTLEAALEPTVTTDILDGSVQCPNPGSPTLSKPIPNTALLVLEPTGSTTLYSFTPFVISDTTFPSCGFTRYEVETSSSTSNIPLVTTNPHVSDICLSVSDCLTRLIDTSVERTLTIQISAFTVLAQFVHTYNIEVVCEKLVAGFDPTQEVLIDASQEMNGQVQLPFALIGRNEGCGVQKVELLSQSGYVFYPDQETKQAYVEIDNTKLGSFSFDARATLYVNQILVQTGIINGRVKCPDISPVLVAPLYENVSLLIGSQDPYHFLPFSITEPNIPACGFDQYEITAIDNDGLQVALENPEPNSLCTISSCLQRLIPSDAEKVFTVTIKALSLNPSQLPVQAQFIIQIVDCSVQKSKVSLAEEVQTFQVHPIQGVLGEIQPHFQASNIKCPIKSIEIIDSGVQELDLPSPCDPTNGCNGIVQYDQTQQKIYRFYVKAIAFGGSFHLTDLIQIEICDPNAMMALDEKISKIYSIDSGEQTIKFAEHNQLLYMESCTTSCPLSYYKIEGDDTEGFSLNQQNDIIISTSKPFKKTVFLVGIMSNPECQKVIVDQKKIALEIEVCGLEKVYNINKRQQLEFKVGKEPKQVQLSYGDYFENSSTSCPIVEYNIVKNTQGEKLSNTDGISQFVQIDEQTKTLTILNNLGEGGTYTFYLQALTGGKIAAYEPITASFTIFTNSAPFFSSPLVDQTIKADQEINSPFIYVSPNAEDLESNSIQFSFFMNFPCKCASVKSDDSTFTFSVDKSKLTAADEGQWVVSIQLKDDMYFESKNVTIETLKVNIEFSNDQNETQGASKSQEQNQTTTEVITNSTSIGGSNSSITSEENKNYDKGKLLSQKSVSDEKFLNLNSQSEIQENEEKADKPIETPAESAMAQEKNQPRILTIQPAREDWQQFINEEIMKKKLADSERIAQFKAKQAQERFLELLQQQKNLKLPPPVAYEIESISRNGKITIKFNQKIIIPDFVQKLITKKRKLSENAFDGIDVARDVVDFKFVLKSNEEPEEVKFFLSIQNWTEEKLIINLNFTRPLGISKGLNKDAIVCNFKNPKLFISKETGQMMQETISAQTIPRQVPAGINPEEVESNAKMTSNMVQTMMLLQLILSIFLKGALNDLWGLFFTLQVLCYITIYDTVLPSSADIYVTEVRKIIEFDVFSPEGFIKLFNPSFNLRAYIDGQKIAINKDQEASMISTLQVYILLAVVAVIMVILSLLTYAVIKYFSENPENAKKIKAKLIILKNKWTYNGTLRSIYISYLEVCLASATQLKLLIKGSRYVDSNSAQSAAGTAVYVYGVIGWMVVTIFRNKHNFDEKGFKAKYENMYIGVKYWKNDTLRIYYWPFFFFRRIQFVTIPILVFQYPSIQLQVLCFLTSLYIVMVVNMRPHADFRHSYLEIFNESVTMFSCYHMFCFTNFNLDEKMKFYMGYSMILFILITFLVNVGFMIWQNVSRWNDKRRLRKKRTFYIQHKQQILRQEQCEILYNQKSKQICLKTQFLRQEEQRMIKQAERAFLEAKIGRKRKAAQKVVDDWKTLSPAEKKAERKNQKIRHIKKVTRLELIKEMPSEEITSDEDNKFDIEIVRKINYKQ